MSIMRRTTVGLLFALIILSARPERSSALGAAVSGSGLVRGTAALAEFSVQLDDGRSSAFSYFDFSSDPARSFSLYDGVQVDCLGQLFGGQTIRLTGNGSDSSAPNEPTIIQVFLVDGGSSGPDRISLKARRPDGRVVYFLPMRDLEVGELSVNCSA